MILLGAPLTFKSEGDIMSIKCFHHEEVIDCMEGYTIFPYLDDSEPVHVQCMYLDTCTTGQSVSMWGEIDRHDLSYVKGLRQGQITFIGRVVSFDSLPEQLQKHITARLEA